jgi:hypothetical protein
MNIQVVICVFHHVFWDLTNILEEHNCFLPSSALKMEASGSLKTSVTTYQNVVP